MFQSRFGYINGPKRSQSVSCKTFLNIYFSNSFTNTKFTNLWYHLCFHPRTVTCHIKTFTMYTFTLHLSLSRSTNSTHLSHWCTSVDLKSPRTNNNCFVSLTIVWSRCLSIFRRHSNNESMINLPALGGLLWQTECARADRHKECFSLFKQWFILTEKRWQKAFTIKWR